MRFLLALLFSICFTASFAQIYNPVKWETEYKQINETEFDLIFKATIEDGWTIYSQYLDGEDGPIPTSFNYDNTEHFELVGKNKESDNAKKTYDKVFEMDLIKFYEYARFTQRVKVKDLSKPIVGYLEFMTCDATKCLPPDMIDFNFELKSTVSGKSTEKENEKEPKPEEKKENPKDDLSLSSSNNDGSGGNNQDQKNNTPADLGSADSAQSGGLLQPAKWTIETEKISDNEFNLIFKAKIDDGWYLYSQFQENEDGPASTEFNYDLGEHFELVGKTEESENRKKVYDKVFEMDVQKFSHDATFIQKIKVNDTSKPITGYLVYQTCDDAKCIMSEEDIYVDGKTLTALISDLATAKINAGNGEGGQGTGPNIEGNVIDQIIPSLKTTYIEPVGDCGEEDVATGQNLFWTFILGFLGGLVALLTPCVFPMIPLTVSFFTKGSKDRKTGIKNGITYGLAIIFIYVLIGLFITAVFGATALNALSTNWIANTLFFAIFVAFAISFFGYYEITLPSSWANKSDSMADQGGLLGTFFMAGTLAIVSFSCTGPIIGSAIVESATSALGPFIVMLGFSTALALPFGLFAAFPAWLNSLPKSGSWMNSVKVVLGFLELALAFKFLSVADMTNHWNILGYEIFMVLWILIFGAMTLYLFGVIKFPHDSPIKKLSPTRWGFALLSLAATAYLCTGFTFNEKTESYNSLSLLSGLAPPAHYNYFLPEPQVDPVIKAKYPSYTKCANNINCFKDYYEGLEYAKETKKPILVDFTGLACVNCRKTEEHIWIADKIWDKLNVDFVLISLYVDDRKKLEKTFLSKNTQEKIRNVGNKWADFQIVNFNQNSQPLYVMVTPDEKVLAKPRGYKEGISDYDDFLDCGLTTFENMGNGVIGGK